MQFIRKIVSYIYEIFKGKDNEDTQPTKNGIDRHGDSGANRDEQALSPVLGETSARGGGERAESEQRRETDVTSEGGRGVAWNIAEIWNNNFLSEQEIKPEPRDWLRGSDLGKPMSDIYLKMKGEEYTNPPNNRSLRKFEAGNIWEWIVKLMLMRAGLHKSTQDDVEFTYDGLLTVKGHPDFIAGGKPDWKKARESLEELPLPPVIKNVYNKLVEHFEKNYPNGVEEIVFEIKSTSGDFFNVLERSGKALKIHRLQLYNYLKSLNKPVGAVVYVSRDDCRLLTIPVYNPTKEVEEEYYDYIKQMTEYYRKDEMPPIEQPITWDSDMQKIKKNSMIGWSPYLTKLYGFEDQLEFDNKYTPIQASFTRVLSRIANEDKMTDKNLEAIEKMKSFGFDPYDVAKKYYKKDK